MQRVRSFSSLQASLGRKVSSGCKEQPDFAIPKFKCI